MNMGMRSYFAKYPDELKDCITPFGGGGCLIPQNGQGGQSKNDAHRRPGGHGEQDGQNERRKYSRLSEHIEHSEHFEHSRRGGRSEHEERASMVRNLTSVGLRNETELKIGINSFMVTSSPIKNTLGEPEYVIEVFHNVTRLKSLQEVVFEQNEKFEYDLSMAKMLQRRLLPAGSPNPSFDFSYIYEPCEALGGDFIDMYNISDTHLGVYIADVSGHGVAASILTVFLRSTISKRITSPAEALSRLYREFKSNNFEPELYITVFYAIFDLKNMILTYSNAGHIATPVLQSGKRKDALKFLGSSGVPISTWVDTAEYTQESISVESGDRLFLHTDGLIDVFNSKMERYGHQRVTELLKFCPDDIYETLNIILDDAYTFAGIKNRSEQSDDITLSLVELK